MVLEWQKKDEAHTGGQCGELTGISVGGSDTVTQMAKEKPSALPAENMTILGICIADILSLGGVWQPVGTKTIADRNARAATSTTKDDNTCSGSRSTQSEPDWLELSMIELTRRNGGPLRSLSNWNENLQASQRPWSSAWRDQLNEKDATRMKQLRKERTKALYMAVDTHSKHWARVRYYSRELHAITNHYGYSPWL